MLPVRQLLRSVHPLLAIWHVYKNVVGSVYHAFMPFMAALHFDILDETKNVKVYAFPKMIEMETVIACALLAAKSAKTKLEMTVDRTPVWASNYDPFTDIGERILQQRDALHAMLYQYVPAVFALGVQLRGFSWKMHGAKTGKHVKVFLMRSLTVLLSLHANRQSASGCHYEGAVSLALLLWDSLNDYLPAAAYVEEGCEAMLSRFSRTLKHDVTIASMDEHHRTFVSMGKTQQTPHAVDSPRFSQRTVTVIRQRLFKLIDRLFTGTVPFVPPPKGDKQESLITPKKEWPSQFQLPMHLHAIDELEMEMSLLGTLHKLIGVTKIPPSPHEALKTACAEGVGHVDLEALRGQYKRYRLEYQKMRKDHVVTKKKGTPPASTRRPAPRSAQPPSKTRSQSQPKSIARKPAYALLLDDDDKSSVVNSSSSGAQSPASAGCGSDDNGNGAECVYSAMNLDEPE